MLTTSAHDSPTNNGEDNDDGGCNSNHLISRHVLTSRAYLTLSPSILQEQPAKEKGARKSRMEGNPDPKRVSTSFAERQNLTMRMQMRRFTRLTNGFSKRFENHCHALALYFVWYNFVKQHKSLGGLSPAMAAGLSDTLWSMTDLAEMIDATLPKPGRRGSHLSGILENYRVGVINRNQFPKGWHLPS